MFRKYPRRDRKAHVYIQFFDENKLELCGSEHNIRCDARKSKDTIFAEFRAKAYRQAEAHKSNPKHYCMNKWHYMQLTTGYCPSRSKNISEIVPIFDQGEP